MEEKMEKTLIMIGKTGCIPCKIAKEKLEEKGYTVLYLDSKEMTKEQKEELVSFRKKLDTDLTFPIIIGYKMEMGYDPEVW